MTIAFTRVPHPSPLSAEDRAKVLADPGFGKHFTDHMVTIDYSVDEGWHNAQVMPVNSIELSPASFVLHYGQAIFEGLKAYRQPDGSIATFRIESNAARFQRSARRMAMAELPTELFIESIKQLLAVDHEWVPAAGGEEALYLRPFMFATEVGLGVKPSSTYRYMVLASPAGVYFKGGVKPVKVWVSTEYVRAVPGGTGEAKFAGNYAASLLAQQQSLDEGCDQVIWLDGIERVWIEEMGTNNLFFVYGSGGDAKLVTPALSGSLLAGITRDSLLTLAADAGFEVEERRISIHELKEKAASGEITEAFGCGTAAVITPLGWVKSEEGEFAIAGGVTGDVTMALRDTLTGIQRGLFADTHNWMMKIH
ncbi:MAG: branched-chain amino acid aminotransferase [Nocardiaceae bacterium]|nr:branched-chain amino acid aminotransferase [Nocardiaceae bacterium]